MVANNRSLRAIVGSLITGFLAVLAVVAGISLFDPQHRRIGDLLVDVKNMIGGHTAPTSPGQPSTAKTHAAKSGPHSLRPAELELKHRPGEQGSEAPPSVASSPEEVNKPADQVVPFRLELVDSNNRRWLLAHRSTRVVSIHYPRPGEATGVRVEFTDGQYKVDDQAIPQYGSVSTSSSPIGGISREISGGLPKQQPAPTYPTPALQEQVQGSVVLQAVISKDGSVQNVRLVSGPPILASAVMEAVRKWHYEPYYRNGEPVEVETQITVDFTISTK